MERITATLDHETAAEIRRVAGRRGVSKFRPMAARERLQRLRLIALLDDLDRRHGRHSRRVRDEVAADARRIFGR